MDQWGLEVVTLIPNPQPYKTAKIVFLEQLSFFAKRE